ncbi:DEAH-box RNA-dependent ATPase PRP2 [Nakaseomyces bracarensis]|uniref:DEAH-box RNA-dependent ATPase PRP2 n=1 Tax=Nakaseomyces bracarensis TaxID=273131 RepID=UPI00387210F2
MARGNDGNPARQRTRNDSAASKITKSTNGRYKKVHGNLQERQNLWEDKQMKNALKNDKVDEIVVDSEKYDFVFDTDSMIDFTNNDAKGGGEDDEYDEKLYLALEEESKRVRSIKESRKKLPVFQYREQLLNIIKENQVVIIVGETGSGKTTQLPQYLVEEGFTKGNKFQVAVTQPRRVAATSVASRVADEMEVELGKEVGYSIRFDDKTTPGKTILKYMTDGMLLREFLADPEVNKYSCIMIDEAHERTIATDLLLGLLKTVLGKRPDLRVIISSATMNAMKFSEFFDKCPIFNVPGRRYPVDIHYTVQPESNYVNAAITTIFQIHTTQPTPGDILVFLTGQDEIETMKDKVESILSKLGSRIPQMIITPIYANLPQEQQARIFTKTPDNCRKVVLATNIAETSLTIDGIKYVIDPGFVKENTYIPSTGMTQLLTVPCSKASVDQRAGRAGRVGPGKCFRLFTKWTYSNELEMMPKPEILRTNLSQTVLLLLSLGVKDLLNFPLLDKPTIPSLKKSLENLYGLGALNSKGQITQLGKIITEFPCEPEFAKVLYSAAMDPKCEGVLEECLTIVSMLHETTSLFVGLKKEAVATITGHVDSDHMLYLDIYNQWKNAGYARSWCQDHKIQFKTISRVKNIRRQLDICCKKLKIKRNVPLQDTDVSARIIKAFISGFPSNIVRLGTTGYTTVGKNSGGLTIYIHPSSIVFQNYKEAGKPAKYILYQQLMLTSKEYIRDCLPVPDDEWLHEMVPQIFTNKNQ